MTIEFPQRWDVSLLDQEIAACDFTDCLSSTETLSSVSLVSTGTTGLTLGTPAVTVTTESIYNRSVAAGKGVLWTVSGQAINQTYKVRVAVTTSASRVLNRLAIFSCK